MSKYLLKLVDSEKIESIIEWDGIEEIFIPSEYTLEPFISEETDFINYEDSGSIFTTSYFETESTKSQFVTEDFTIFRGQHFGNISGSVTWNGKTLGQITSETEYGKVIKYGSGSFDLITNKRGFYFEESGTLLISKDTIDENRVNLYEKTLTRLYNNDDLSYIIKFKQNGNPNDEIHYLVHKTELVSGSQTIQLTNGETVTFTNDAYRLHGNQVYTPYSTFDTTERTRNDFSSNEWSIDFSFGDETHVGKFIGEHTGSFTGSFEGDAELTGSFTGSFKGVFDGIINGTASYAEYSEYSEISNFTENASTIEVITSTQFWTKPSWAKTIRVTLVGGGGGGGSAPATEDQFYLIGGGGGGGGTVTIAEYDADTLDESIGVFVGAGGSGGTNVTLASNGGSSMFGNLLVARGGNAGQNGEIEFGPGSIGWGFVQGGTSIGKVDYINTGGGGGGAGTINGIIPGLIENAAYASLAPTLPIIDIWLDLPDRGDPTLNYYTTWPIPIPASIAPTGGGGGTGYDPNYGRQNANTFGGTIIGWLPYGLRYEDVLTAYTYYGGSLPAFNSKIGIGGNGGNAYDLSRPTHGADYGGGGGGAYAGGLISGSGVYPDGTPTYTDYNFGANGANGVVVIISEA